MLLLLSSSTTSNNTTTSPITCVPGWIGFCCGTFLALLEMRKLSFLASPRELSCMWREHPRFLCMNEILKAGAAEEETYSKCVQFLLKKSESIEGAVLDSFSTAYPKIIEKARKITAKDMEGIEYKDDLHVPMAFLMAIAKMAKRVVHNEIASRIDGMGKKHVETLSLLTQGIMHCFGAFFRDIYRSWTFNHDGSVFTITIKSNNETMEVGAEIFNLIPEAACCTLNELFPDNLSLSDKLLAQVTSAAIQFVKVDDGWKESIAREYLTTVKVNELAPAILKHCRQEMDEKHARYVRSHKQMIALREATLLASQESNLRPRTHITCSIASLLLRLRALQCALEKGEPEQGDRIGEGRHCTVSTCPFWGNVTTPNTLVLKTFMPLSQELWNELAQSFYATR